MRWLFSHAFETRKGKWPEKRKLTSSLQDTASRRLFTNLALNQGVFLPNYRVVELNVHWNTEVKRLLLKNMFKIAKKNKTSCVERQTVFQGCTFCLLPWVMGHKKSMRHIRQSLKKEELMVNVWQAHRMNRCKIGCWKYHLKNECIIPYSCVTMKYCRVDEIAMKKLKKWKVEILMPSAWSFDYSNDSKRWNKFDF